MEPPRSANAPIVSQYVLDQISSKVYVSNNKLFWMLRGIGIMPPGPETCSLKKDFDNKIVTFIEGLDETKLSDLARRINEILMKDFMSVTPKEKLDLVLEAVPLDEIMKIEDDYMRLIYKEKFKEISEEKKKMIVGEIEKNLS